MNELLEKLKAIPERTRQEREWGQRHDELRQRQFCAALDKIQQMTPGLYSYQGVPNRATPRFFLITNDHKLWDAEEARDTSESGMAGFPPSSFADPDLLWRLKRIA